MGAVFNKDNAPLDVIIFRKNVHNLSGENSLYYYYYCYNNNNYFYDYYYYYYYTLMMQLYFQKLPKGVVQWYLNMMNLKSN